MYEQWLDNLRARRLDPIVKKAVYEQLYYKSNVVRYTLGTMQPVHPSHTEATYKEARSVQQKFYLQLKNAGIDVEFEFQGSVTNDTHLLAYSDIDILTLLTKFVVLEHPQKPASPYYGDPTNDLMNLRVKSIPILQYILPSTTVDSSGSKSISLSGGSLQRKMDIVPSNWLITNKYKNTNKKYYKGVQVLDAKKIKRIDNYPFLNNEQIKNRDKKTHGNMRKLTRLLKSIKYDSRQVDMSSFDITALMYNMEDSYIMVPLAYDLKLVHNCKEYLDYVSFDEKYRESLKVPDGSRKIFCSQGANLIKLKQLITQLVKLIENINVSIGSQRNLTEVQIHYSSI